MRTRLPVIVFTLGVVLGCEAGETPGSTDAVASSDPEGGDTGGGDVEPPTPDAGPPLSFCEDETQFLYDPEPGKVLAVFPDDYWSEDTEDGVSLAIPDGLGWVADIPGAFASSIAELNGNPGFACSAPVFLRFSEKVMLPSGGPEFRLVELPEAGATEAPIDVPFEAHLIDDQTTVVLTPHRPLTPRRRHLVVATNDFRAQSGQCIAPGPVLRGVLEGRPAPALARVSERLLPALAAVFIPVDQVSAAAVFTTQDPVQDDRVVAADIRSREFAWSSRSCQTLESGVRHCENRFSGHDYRTPGVLLERLFAGGTPQEALDYPVSLWLPKGSGPFPVLVFAHGIGADRSQASGFAEAFAGLGLMTVAIDAATHGQHPAGSGGGGQADVLAFFGVDLSSFSIRGRALRDNWRQSAWDKLQLIRLLEADPDIDDDGAVDADMERLAYLGVSLGGIMGPELMALTDRVGAAVLEICGGYLTSIIRDSDQLGAFITLGMPGASPGEVERFLAVAQVLMDAADPVNFSRWLFEQRLPGTGERPASVLFQVAIGDEVIPNSSSWALARALELPHIPPVVAPVVAVPDETMPLPVVGNALDGGATKGLFQFDRVTVSRNGKPIDSGHQTTPGSEESVGQAVRFFESWFEKGTAEIIDPYALYGTPPL